MKIDAHSHSQFSDGCDTPLQLIAHAAAVGLDGVVITDHDSLAGIPYVRSLAPNAPLKVWAGTEVSCCNPTNDQVVHLLCYGLALPALPAGSPAPAFAEKPAPPATSPALPLEQLTRPTLELRLSNARWQVAALQEDGFDITWERVEQAASMSATVYKQHIMSVLTKAPYQDPSYRALYKELFGREGRYWRKVQYPDFRDAVRAIVESGGHAVLAHPGQSGSFGFVPELVEGGLCGIERNHPDHTERHARMVDELLERYGLIGTGGSDYHGVFGRHQSLGQCLVEERFVEALCSILE